MLYIILFLCVCCIVLSFYIETRPNYYGDLGAILGCIGFLCSIVVLVTILVVGCNYNSVKSTANAQLEVLNSQNEIVLTQIEPLVQQALNYESNTYKELKLTPENIVAFGNMYPQLQANSFIQSQINIIVENQKEIKDLKLEIASLNAYRLWLFTKKE